MRINRTHGRAHFPDACRRIGARRRMQGGALVELVIIGVPIIMFLTLGMVQLILIGHARVTLNYATLLSARQGAVHHAKLAPMRNGLAAGLAPMFGAQAAVELQTPETESVAASDVTEKAMDLAHQDISDFARITILNPTVEAFEDFARPIRLYGGHVGIPNAGLYRMSGASTRTVTVRVCKPTATPTVKDLQAPLRIKVPSKDELKSALLGGVATDAWGGDWYSSGVSQSSRIVSFRNRISEMIDQAELDSPTSAIELYSAIKNEADAFIQKYKTKLPEWQINQVLSVVASADILAKATSGSARPSEGELRAAIGPTGRPGGYYLDMGSAGMQDAWDVWTCGTAGNNQSRLGCVHGKSTSDSLWGLISQAYESPTGEINYTKLANRIEKMSVKFKTRYGSGGNGTPTFELEQERFVQHVISLFDILGKSRDLGPYRNTKLCSMKTLMASAQPAVGAASGVNIQDANLLKIHVLYGYKLIVPFVGSIIVDFMRLFNYMPAGGLAHDLVQQIYANGRIPLTATAVVRMQTPAYKNAAMLKRSSSFFVDG